MRILLKTWVNFQQYSYNKILRYIEIFIYFYVFQHITFIKMQKFKKITELLYI